jgi:hypothetical protein
MKGIGLHPKSRDGQLARQKISLPTKSPEPFFRNSEGDKSQLLPVWLGREKKDGSLEARSPTETKETLSCERESILSQERVSLPRFLWGSLFTQD